MTVRAEPEYTDVELRNIATIRAFRAAPFVERTKYLAPDFVNLRHGIHELGPLTGTAGYSPAGIPDRVDDIEDIIAKGDKVWARWTVNGTHLGSLLGVAPTGRPISMLEIGVYTLRDAKITEAWFMADEIALAVQLDILHSPSHVPTQRVQVTTKPHRSDRR